MVIFWPTLVLCSLFPPLQLELRHVDLVFFDLIWLWESYIDCLPPQRELTPSQVNPIVRGALIRLKAEIKQGVSDENFHERRVNSRTREKSVTF